jgi:hypothetical protein
MDKVGSCCSVVLVASAALLGVTWILNKICWVIICIGTDTPIFG